MPSPARCRDFWTVEELHCTGFGLVFRCRSVCFDTCRLPRRWRIAASALAQPEKTPSARFMCISGEGLHRLMDLRCLPAGRRAFRAEAWLWITGIWPFHHRMRKHGFEPAQKTASRRYLPIAWSVLDAFGQAARNCRTNSRLAICFESVGGITGPAKLQKRLNEPQKMVFVASGGAHLTLPPPGRLPSRSADQNLSRKRDEAVGYRSRMG